MPAPQRFNATVRGMVLQGSVFLLIFHCLTVRFLGKSRNGTSLGQVKKGNLIVRNTRYFIVLESIFPFSQSGENGDFRLRRRILVLRGVND